MFSPQQPDHRPSWYRSFQYLLIAVRVYFLVLIACFIYLLANGSLDSWWYPNAKTNPPAVLPATTTAATEQEEVANGIHLATGLIYAEGFEPVRATCTACHSAQLVTQNRATRAGWKSMIEWMQATQGLWDLGEQEATILDYLAKYYAPAEVGRRMPIEVAAIEWYLLEL
jgi:cytochrome c5